MTTKIIALLQRLHRGGAAAGNTRVPDFALIQEIGEDAIPDIEAWVIAQGGTITSKRLPDSRSVGRGSLVTRAPVGLARYKVYDVPRSALSPPA